MNGFYWDENNFSLKRWQSFVKWYEVHKICIKIDKVKGYNTEVLHVFAALTFMTYEEITPYKLIQWRHAFWQQSDSMQKLFKAAFRSSKNKLSEEAKARFVASNGVDILLPNAKHLELRPHAADSPLPSK